MTEVIVAVDGGGSKTDAVALSRDGEVLAQRRGPGSSPHFEGVAESVLIVDELVQAVAAGHPVVQADLYLSGLDLPGEIGAYRAAVSPLGWAQRGLVVENDLYALLRAGTEEPDAMAIVCGSGINAIGVRADGATVRFPSLGQLSGDWGGGSGLGPEALWHAARDVDGRGPHTALTAAICAELAVGSVPELIEQLHFGQRSRSDLITLAPVVFAAAEAGDAVAGALVDRQADEVAAFARTIATRLGFAHREVPIVLGGSILQAGDHRLDRRVTAGLHDAVPRARIVRLQAPPLVGAALAALAHAGCARDALARARGLLTGAVQR